MTKPEVIRIPYKTGAGDMLAGHQNKVGLSLAKLEELIYLPLLAMYSFRVGANTGFVNGIAAMVAEQVAAVDLVKK